MLRLRQVAAQRAQRFSDNLEKRGFDFPNPQDEIDPSEPVEVAWNLHTSALVQTIGDRAVLVQGGERLELRILSPQGAVFKEICACAPLPQAQQPEVKNLTILLPVSKHTRIAVLFGTTDMKAPKLQSLKTWR